MKSRQCAAVGKLVIALLLSVRLLRGQTPDPLLERLRAADAAAALDSGDIKPWHLKMTVKLFGDKGKQTGEGTIEEWRSSPDLDRREYKTSAYSATEIRSGGKLYRTAGADLPPYYLEQLRLQVVHPGPPRLDDPMSRPELRLLKVGAMSLDCIQLRSVQGTGPIVLGSVPTYCLTADSESLRMSLSFSSLEMVRSTIGKFQGKEVPVDLLMLANNVEAASAHIDTLADETIDQSEFAMSAEVPEVVPRIIDSSEPHKLDTMPGPVSQPQPLYPVQAKQQHLAGRVLVRAIIGTNGAVRDVKVISSTNPIFIDSAINAVSKWRYRPSTQNGQPVEVETIINVAFSFG